MPRIAVPACVGPTNTLRSINADDERTINLYLEGVKPGQSKIGGYLAPTPGLSPFAQVGDSPGSCIFYEDGRCFVIVGTTFAEVNSDGTTTARGSVTASTSALPSSVVSNGTAGGQLLIASGGDGYVYNLTANTLTQITAANFPGTGFPDPGTCLMVEFLDGYGVALVANSRKFFLSALEDFTSWDPLDVAERSEGSDNLMGVRRSHRELWFPGTLTGEVWYDAGDPLFPLAPVPGVFLETGAACSHMARIGDEGIAWIGLNERGNGVVYMADGYTPKRVSTTAIERRLQQSTDLSAAWMFTQQQEGHVFVWIIVPDLDTSFCYDVTVNGWHERALWNPATAAWEPHLASSYAFAFGKHLITDRLSGVIYELSLTAYSDSVVPS